MIPRRRYDIEENLFGIIASSILSKMFVKGEEVAQFEQTFSDILSSKSRHEMYSTATSSGREALVKLLMALRVPKDQKIMIPSYTLGALVPFLHKNGFECKVCDVDKAYPVITAEEFEKQLTTDVSCVLLTHLFGYIGEIEDICEIAKAHNVLVIEDCAHCLGSSYYEYMPGTFGDGALFSFDILKTVNTFGGGMAVTRHENVAKQIVQLEKNEKAPSHFEVLKKIGSGLTEEMTLATPLLKLPTGMLAFEETRPLIDFVDRKLRRPASSNSVYKCYSNVQAQCGLSQLKTLEDRVQKKRYIAKRILDTLEIEDKQINGNSYKQSNAYYLVVKAAGCENASQIRKELWFKGIDAGYGSEIADDIGGIVGEKYQNSADWFLRAIQLPCYSSMSDETLNELLSKLQGFKGRLVKD